MAAVSSVAKRLPWAFVATAAALAAIVAIGFAPSFYLRDWSVPAKHGFPAYLVLHGIALTAWFLLFVVQASLVAIRRVRWHRTLGVAGVALAVVVVVLSAKVVLAAPARNLAAGATVAQISLMVIGDIALLILFSTLVALAIHFRSRPDAHKRLMAIASISIVAPAIARWPGAEAAMPLSVIVPQFAFLGALIVYDLVTRRRVHPATLFGIVAYVVVVGVSVPLALSAWGRRFVEALG